MPIFTRNGLPIFREQSTDFSRGSRNLYALALAKQAPRMFARCNRNGVPWIAVLATWTIGLLTYLNCNETSSVVFGWFSNMTSVASLFSWLALSVTYIRFQKGCLHHGITDLPFKAKASKFIGYWAAGSCAFIILVQGYEVFVSIPRGVDYYLDLSDSSSSILISRISRLRTSVYWSPRFRCLYG